MAESAPAAAEKEYAPMSVASAPPPPSPAPAVTRSRSEAKPSAPPAMAPKPSPAPAAPPPPPSGGAAKKKAEPPKADKAMKAEADEMAADDAAPKDVAAGEAYAKVDDNPFRSAKEEPLSTFSIDVDTASYANVRRFITGGSLPPPDSVRIEELVNYFVYNYNKKPNGKDPFSADVEVARCPWNPEHRLARVAIKGREVSEENRKGANLVFLLDVSGSMSDANKLPLLKTALKMLVNNLSAKDRVAIAVYAGASGLVLPSTPCDNKRAIIEALDRLESGGSTNAGAGIDLAYQTAQQGFINGGINRVILATDGDFNVGTTSSEALLAMITEKAKQGVFLTVLGFGMGNYKDSTLELLADKGNGNYAYIDTEGEARKVLVEQMGGTLVTIAKDVKLQIEFNPAKVAAYRLIGYENRILAAEDFTNDKKDAGEIGAGHTVTAFYELVPQGAKDLAGLKLAPPVKTDVKPEFTFDAKSVMVVKMRYKEPNGSKSIPLAFPVADRDAAFDQASADFRFAAAVAGYGMMLRHSPHKGTTNWDLVQKLAGGALGTDPGGYRKEFIDLARKASTLAN
jgi:Ca-activated chloride channel family protein